MTGNVTIEPAAYDGPVAAALVAELQDEYGVRYGGPDATPVDPSQFSTPSGCFLVARLDGDAVGCVGLRRHDDERAEMKRLFVRPEQRGKGISRALLQAAEEEAVRLGYAVLIAETGLEQPEAIGLYERSGYDRIPGFGHYRGSPLNRCYGKRLTSGG